MRFSPFTVSQLVKIERTGEIFMVIEMELCNIFLRSFLIRLKESVSKAY
jgi:hypothetical protein